ncbi:MAG: hypothetical protein OXU78_01015 [Deltaproteobacteria bacterium]|nr:hypothetical protein [Deltaproteobacteria bacterium]
MPLFKVNGKELETDKEELTAREILNLAAEKGIIPKDGEWHLYDAKGTPIDMDAKAGENPEASYTATRAGRASVAL